MHREELVMYRHLAQQHDHGNALVTALWQDYVEKSVGRTDTRKALLKDLRMAADEAWFDKKEWKQRCRHLARMIRVPFHIFSRRGKRWSELATTVADALITIADDPLSQMERSLDDPRPRREEG